MTDDLTNAAPTPDDAYREAVWNGDVERAAQLAHTVTLGLGSDGRTALYLAAGAGADEASAILLARGEDPRLVEESEWSLARKACLSGSAALVRALIDGGVVASEELPFLFETTVAAFGRHKRVAQDPERGLATLSVLFAQRLDGSAPSPTFGGTLAQQLGLQLLRRRNPQELHIAILQRALDAGFALEAIFAGEQGDALFEVAQVWEEPVLLTFLFEHGISVAGTEGRGTVLHGLASRVTSRDELALWISRGARLEGRDGRGRTPLLVAASNALLETARALVELGAEDRAVDEKGLNARSLVVNRHEGGAWLAWLDERGVPDGAPDPTPAPPPHAAIASGARKARVVQGSFKGMDAFVSPRSDGKVDAVINVFGRNLAQILEASDVTLL